MKFGQLHRKVSTKLVVSPRHDAWLAKNSNPTYSPEAIDFGKSALEAQAYQRDRSGSFSASSVDSCKRRQQFTYLGLPEMEPSPKTASIFHNGTFMHIRWQMAGITEGWLTAPEVAIPENDLWLKGTMDGVLYEGSIVEFKSINSFGFSQVATFGPTESHLSQGATYSYATGGKKVVFIYEDKNTQEYREFVREPEQLPMKAIQDKAGELWGSIDAKELYEPLGGCMDGTGYQYTGCPFRDRCLSIRKWEEVDG